MSTQPETGNPGARMISLETEVPGTPEQVWRAIATTEGLSTWYMPSTVEEREGGTITMDMGPWGNGSGTVTAWDPPRRFAFAETDWNPGVEVPAWATEILVEARDGGTCVVRLVTGLTENGEAWEEMLGKAAQGFTQALETLRLSLTYFPGRTGTQVMTGAVVRGEVDQVRDRLLAAAGLAGAAPGEAVKGNGTPALEGLLESADDSGVLVRTSEPTDGLVHIRVWPGAPGDVVMAVKGVFCADDAAEVAAREEPRWQAWLSDRFRRRSAPVNRLRHDPTHETKDIP